MHKRVLWYFLKWPIPGSIYLTMCLCVLASLSSPHLMEVRERIRINGKPLPKETFARYFFDCWDNLLNNGDVSNQRNVYLMLFRIPARGDYQNF